MTIRVGIDLDDVLFDTVPAWLKRHNEITGDNVEPEDVKSWDIAQYLNKGSRDSFFYILQQSDFWQTVEPVKDAIAYMWKLCTEHDNIEVYVVTSTHYSTTDKKMRHLYKLFPFLDDMHSVIITGDKYTIDLDILVDDNPENLCMSKKGVVKVLFDRPHNEWCDVEGIGALRVYNWKQLYGYITTLAWLESEDAIEA